MNGGRLRRLSGGRPGNRPVAGGQALLGAAVGRRRRPAAALRAHDEIRDRPGAAEQPPHRTRAQRPGGADAPRRPLQMRVLDEEEPEAGKGQ